jgi:prophage antirepressor-like protein
MIYNIKMELINQIDETICFDKNNIRVIGSYNEPWFVAKDICNILELKDVSNALLNIPDKWKDTKVIRTLGGNQDMRIINEGGLYKLIMRSNKKIAQKFQEFVCEEILPSIRKTGEYKMQKIIEEKQKLLEEKEKILEENNHLKNVLSKKPKD